MASEILDVYLREYEQKKLKAELDLEKRKEALYEKVPKLAQIEDELNHFAILTAKNILKSSNNQNLIGDESKSVLDDDANNSKTLSVVDKSLASLQQKVDLLKYEKAKILSSLNLEASYLKPFYECQICKDTGYVMDDNYKTTMCSCLKQKLLDCSFNKSNMSNLDKENFSTFNSNLFSDEVDIAKYKFNISPRANIINIKNKCIDFVNNFEDPNYKNLLFTGNTGLR